MAKGLDAISQLIQEEAKSDRPKSRLSYLKKNQSIRDRIPEDILDNLHVYKVVEVFQKINQTLSYSAEGRPARKIGRKWAFKCSELDAWVKSGKSAIK